jgi:hypothetical protein
MQTRIFFVIFYTILVRPLVCSPLPQNIFLDSWRWIHLQCWFRLPAFIYAVERETCGINACCMRDVSNIPVKLWHLWARQTFDGRGSYLNTLWSFYGGHFTVDFIWCKISYDSFLLKWVQSTTDNLHSFRLTAVLVFQKRTNAKSLDCATFPLKGNPPSLA